MGSISEDVPLRDVVTPPALRQRYEQAGWWDDSTLAGGLASWASATPDDVAVVDATGERTYAELARDVGVLAGHLTRAGVGSGSVASLQLPNVYAAVVAAAAVQSLGAVINPLLTNYRARELAHVFSTARPAVVFTPNVYRGCDYRELISSVAADTGVRPLRVRCGPETTDEGTPSLEGILAESGDDQFGRGQAASVSELIFTSGTEAAPKAIMHTEQTANFSVRAAYADLGLTREDVVWMPSPVGHSTGFNYGVRFALQHGLKLVLQDRWDPHTAAALIQKHRVSYTLAATTFLQDLVEVLREQGSSAPSFRHFGCGGAPVPAELVRAAERVGVDVLRLYGSTEALVATWNRPESPPDKRQHTDGRAMSGVEVAVHDEDGRTVPPDAGGEIVIRGPNTCVGFFRDAERTGRTFQPDGFVRSGDLASIDRDGYLTVTGRKKEIIIRGGVNITPREVEDVVATFPEVERVAIVGVPDERLGERACACVVVRAGATLTLESLVARLRGSGIATYKLPERLHIVASMPTTASGKVQKHELVRALAGGADGQRTAATDGGT